MTSRYMIQQHQLYVQELDLLHSHNWPLNTIRLALTRYLRP
jgi:hypothetical protein